MPLPLCIWVIHQPMYNMTDDNVSVNKKSSTCCDKDTASGTAAVVPFLKSLDSILALGNIQWGVFDPRLWKLHFRQFFDL